MEPDLERMDVSPFLKLKGLVKKKHLHSGVVNYGTIYQPVSRILLVIRVLKLL